LSGGYDAGSDWLGNLASISGVVVAFAPNGVREPAAIIKLDEPLNAGGVTGDFVVMWLRWVGATWNDEGIVHIELCDFEPEHRAWDERRKGKWIESHAHYAKL
jgi:hypothetical protein